jgi:hypothetical protein
MAGMIGGVLIGGWVADRTDRHLPFVVMLTIGAAALLLLAGVISLAAVLPQRPIGREKGEEINRAPFRRVGPVAGKRP